MIYFEALRFSPLIFMSALCEEMKCHLSFLLEHLKVLRLLGVDLMSFQCIMYE